MVTFRRKRFGKRAFKAKRRMPYRNKRMNIRRRLMRKPGVSRFRAPLGNFPAQKTVALRYVDTKTLDPVVGGTAVATVFRANNIFDPDFSGAGHQPMYRDNYAALYDRYRVNHATITMVALGTHVTNTTTAETTLGTTVGANQFFISNNRACRMFIVRDETASDFSTDLNTLVEEGNQNFVWRYCPQNSSPKMPILRFSCWPHRQFSVDRKDESLTADQGGGPANECFFICGVTDLGDATNIDSMTFQFIITYNVTFYDLIKTQAQQ